MYLSAKIETHGWGNKRVWCIWKEKPCLISNDGKVSYVPMPENLSFGTVFPGELLASTDDSEVVEKDFFKALEDFENEILEQYNLIQVCKKSLGVEYKEYLKMRTDEIDKVFEDLDSLRDELYELQQSQFYKIKNNMYKLKSIIGDLRPGNLQVKNIEAYLGETES